MRSAWASVWALASALALGACGDDGDRGPLYCHELIPGEVVDPEIGMTSANRVIVQAAADVFVAAKTATVELSSACASIAIDLGADTAAIDDALATSSPGDPIAEICRVAADAISRDGTIRLTTADPICTTSSALVAACVKQCVPASDDCSLSCDASARASAECPMPADARFGRVLALRARLALLAETMGRLSAAENASVTIKAACIPILVSSTSEASRTVTGALTAAGKVIAAAKGSR